MTAIVYSDCEATSPNGKYTLEARSPDNGTISSRDGSKSSVDDFAFKYFRMQRNFRYQLLEATCKTTDSCLSGKGGGSVLWERWQEDNENSPHEVVVSNEGWSILRTHGEWPEVIAVSIEGSDVIRVMIDAPPVEDEDYDGECQRFLGGNRHLWYATHMLYSSAGKLWTDHSWRYFFQRKDTEYFVWRTSWSQRLVIDLTNALLLGEEDQQDAALSLAMREEEIIGACSHLRDFADHAEQIEDLWNQRPLDFDSETNRRLWKLLLKAPAAIQLIGTHKAAEYVPLLRQLEPFSFEDSRNASTAMGKGWSLSIQFLRPILHHTLRLLGEEPRGYATYSFTNKSTTLPVREQIADKRQWASELNRSMSGEQVLSMLGAPDHVSNMFYEASNDNRVSEAWDYDFRVAEEWVTLRIAWVAGKNKGRIARIDELPSPWLHSDQREAEILRH